MKIPFSLALLLAGPTLAQMPRVLMVDIDDLGWDMVESTSTPTLDRLRDEGRRFTHFHTTPLCSPSRARLMMGAFGSHPWVLCGGTIKTNLSYELPLLPLTPLPRLVSNHGRTTAKIGKWHLAPLNRPEHPHLLGWDIYSGAFSNMGAANVGDYFLYQKILGGERFWSDVYLTTDETNDALRCVELGVDLISVSYHAIHTPFHIPPPEVYQGPPPTNKLERAQAMLQALDLELGRLLDGALQASYTIFVFSDNGTSTELRGGKGHLVPGGVIVPMWVIGPGVMPGTDDDWVDIVDLYATVTEVMGVPRDLPVLEGPDSISFAQRVYGVGAPTRTAVYSEFWKPNGKDPRHELGASVNWGRSMRTHEWSLVDHTHTHDDAMHFYHRAVDPSEKVDLVEHGMGSIARTAAERLLRFLETL